MPKVVLISDTHSQHRSMLEPVPDGDILIYAGDATMVGRVDEVAAFGLWFRSLPHRHKVFVAGNHDWMFQRNRTMALSLLNSGLIGNERVPAVKYLEDSLADIEGLRIYGSPWQPAFMDWAFNVDRGEAIRRYWDMIPEGIDILVTHGPPMGIHDQTHPHLGSEHLGCEELMAAVERVKPRIHVFGHIHGGYGKTRYVNTLFVNAAICNEQYKPVNAPVVVDLPAKELVE
jgi:calcineurin-like phosphoesterase family protein